MTLTVVVELVREARLEIEAGSYEEAHQQIRKLRNDDLPTVDAYCRVRVYNATYHDVTEEVQPSLTLIDPS